MESTNKQFVQLENFSATSACVGFCPNALNKSPNILLVEEHKYFFIFCHR
jgi:hypothetical protein